jgi:hypothetical protein
MSDFNRRQISTPPHDVGFFTSGEFVFDPEAPWNALRKGLVAEHEGAWEVQLEPMSLGGDWLREPLTTYSGFLGRHVLINHSGIGDPRGPSLDPAPWLAIRDAIWCHVRDAAGRRVRLDELLQKLQSDRSLNSELLEDTMRMDATMGFMQITGDSKGLWYEVSPLTRASFHRKDYLASFSDELLAKSRRIDNLIQHTGTVGGYREELVRSMIRQVLPTQYEVSTGFIENSPRQLDVLVWDSSRYAPLFREQAVVVVPRESVRAVIEVKTTLSTKYLDEALEILYEVMRVDQPLLPVFKGIFAFESEYKSDDSVAHRIEGFHKGLQNDGIIQRVHGYLMQGVTAVCVPRHNYVYQLYVLPDDRTKFPRPELFTLVPDWPGDVRTGVFLGQLLSYLDLETGPKRTQSQLFMPIFQECQTRLVSGMFGPDWQPNLANGALRGTLGLAGAREYVHRVQQFLWGGLPGPEVVSGLDYAPYHAPQRS